MRNDIKESGYNLLEFMIANFIAILLINALLMSYLSVVNNSHFQQALQDLQASVRMAEEILAERIRLAGYVGCANPNQPVDQSQAIEGYDSAHIPSEFNETVVPDTDAVVINSCVSNTTISQNSNLTKMMYFIGDTNRKNSEGKKIFALFQKPLTGDRIELVAGVEKMSLSYGVISSGSITEYYSALQISDWSQVRSINIDLLFNSIDPVLNTPHFYYFQGNKITPTDLLWHQPWTLYITLRERMYGF